MAEGNEFVQVVKFRTDDSDLERSLSKMERRLGEFEKRASNIRVKFKVDPSAQRLLNSVSRGVSVGGASGNTATSSIIREQRHAARSANALAVAFDSVRRAVELFSIRISRVGLSGVAARAVAGMSSGPDGGVVGPVKVKRGLLDFAMAFPGMVQMANMAYQPLKAFAQGSINAFNTQNRAEKLLEFGMQRNGTAGRVQELKDYASDIQRRTIYGDEAMLAAAGGWQNRIKDVNNSKRMMELVADFAAKSTGGGEVSAEQMRGYSQQLMQALSGRAISLKAQGYDISAIEKLQEYKRAGGVVTEDMEVSVLEKVLSSVKGAAEELAKTDEGKIIQTKNAMGDLREEVGRRLQPVFARVASSIMSNMPTIGRLFDSFGNIVERFVQVIADNADTIASFAEKAVGLIEILSEFPGTLLTFGAAAKIASATIAGAEGGGGLIGSLGSLVGRLGGLQGSLTSLATSSLWGILAAEIALIIGTLWEASKEEREAKKRRDAIKEDGKVRSSVIGSYKRYKAGEISEEKYREVFERAKSIGADMSGSMYDIWKQPESAKGGGNSGTDIEKWLASAMKTLKPVTNNRITVNNDIKADSDMTAKIIKDQLRELTTSRLNFTSRTAVAKAMAI